MKWFIERHGGTPDRFFVARMRRVRRDAIEEPVAGLFVLRERAVWRGENSRRTVPVIIASWIRVRD
jgi:hypothetical protein